MIQLYLKEEESLFTAIHNKIYARIIMQMLLMTEYITSNIYMYVLVMSQTDGLAKNKGQIHL